MSGAARKTGSAAAEKEHQKGVGAEPSGGDPVPASPCRPLFQRFPHLRQVVPWMPLGEFPTPVSRLDCLSEHGDVWVKRDDLTAPHYGGNKVRTLEFSLAKALQREEPEVITYGVEGSNWLVASAFYARRFGLRCRAHIFPRYLDPSRRINARLLESLADEVVRHRNGVGLFLGLLRERIRSGRHVCLFPPGGTSAAASLAYVNALLELAEQVEAGGMPRPTVLFAPLGSGGTCAGLLVGLEIVGWETALIGVRVADRVVSNRFTVGMLARGCYRLLRRSDPTLPGRARFLHRFRIDHDWIGAGYGHPTEAAREAIEALLEQELQLDTTYTGKTMACLLQRLRSGRLRHETVLFWHTLNSRPVERLAELGRRQGEKPQGAGS